MSLLQSLAPSHPVLWPTVYAIAVYGLRYLLMALMAFAIARPTVGGAFGGRIGRPHAQAPAHLDLARHVRRELGCSLLSLALFGGVNGVLFGWGLLRASQLYLHFKDYPVWWFWASIPAALLLHDTFFYWLHRAMHHRWLYRTMHQVHHRSVHPTAFAAYSFHPTEALAEALIATAILYIIPMHPLALLLFQTVSTAYNVYGHCGREFYPRGMGSHPLGRWINTATLHAEHHRSGRGNYGLYFAFWDRWMGTNQAPRG